MSQGSPKDHFLNQLEALQKNLDDLISCTKNTASPPKALFEEEIFNLSNELYFSTDVQGHILNVNNASLSTLNFTVEELIGLNFVDLVPIAEKKSCREYLAKLNSGFPTISFEASLVSKDSFDLRFLCKGLKKGDRIFILGTTLKAMQKEIVKENELPTKTLEKEGKNSVADLASDLNISKTAVSAFSDANKKLKKLSSPYSNLDPPYNPATMSTVEANGFVVEVNNLWVQMLGYKREEVLGKEAFQFFDLNSRKIIADELIPQIAASGSVRSDKCKMITKSGKKLQVTISGFLEYSSIQKIYKWLIFSINEEDTFLDPALQEKVGEGSFSSEHHLKAIINSSKQILFLIDKKMNVIAFNKHAEEVVVQNAGKRLKIGNNMLSFLQEADALGLQEIYEDVLNGRSVHFTREMNFNDKEKRWFEVNLFPVEDELIHVNNVVFSAEDITERKQAEEKFKELEINFKSIFTQVAVGVMLHNLNDENIQANKRFYELIEYSKEEFEEIKPVGITHPEDREKSIKHTEDLTSGKVDNFSLEMRYVTKSGRIVWVFLTATVVRNRQGKPKHIISVAQDITLRKTAEQELLYKKSELDTFVYRASHDLRGPVASLMGLYNIVKVEFANDKNAITYFEHYNNSVMRLHTVLQNLIDLTKIKESENKVTQVDIKELIDSCLGAMKNLTDFHRINFEVEIGIDFKVFIDGKKFKTIIKNLVENSVIYATPESNAFVKILVSYQENVLKIDVVDNGRGIDPRIQSKVFNMFFRGTEKSKGSGLGLYIVKNAVEKLNGSIQMSSKLNEGTKFSVYIPYLYEQEYSALLEKNFIN